MVFICKCNDKLIDASDIIFGKNMEFICIDSNCLSKLRYKRKHFSNRYDKEVSISAHFYHINNKNNCNIEKFIKNIGNKYAQQFYRKWTEYFIL